MKSVVVMRNCIAWRLARLSCSSDAHWRAVHRHAVPVTAELQHTYNQLMFRSFHSRASFHVSNNDNVWITQFCNLRTTCLEWSATDFACIIHHTWTVPGRTKDNVRYFAWSKRCDLALSWLFRMLELAPYKCSNLLTYSLTYLLTYLLTYYQWCRIFDWFGLLAVDFSFLKLQLFWTVPTIIIM